MCLQLSLFSLITEWAVRRALDYVLCALFGYVAALIGFVFFFSSRRRHTRFDCDWSSDVCSSDLQAAARPRLLCALDLLPADRGRGADDRADGDGVEGDARSILRRDDPDRARGPAEPGDRDERAGDDAGAAPGPNARRARAEPPVESDALGGTQPRGTPRVPRGAPRVGGMGAMSRLPSDQAPDRGAPRVPPGVPRVAGDEGHVGAPSDLAPARGTPRVPRGVPRVGGMGAMSRLPSDQAPNREAPRVSRGVPRVGGMGAMSGPPSSKWRLVVTEPCDGATNMAIDEALWRGRHAGPSPPTVRFFAWDPPTVSVGYGQPLDRHVDVAACRRLGVGLVRRPTGGSAIYHDWPERELTYCVTATADDLGVGGHLLETYRWIARALVRGLNALGARAERSPTRRGLGPDPAFCFARTGAFEIEAGGRSSSAAPSAAWARRFSSTAPSCSGWTPRACAPCSRPRVIRWRR